MSVTITSKTLLARNWSGDNAKPYLDGVIGDQYKAVIYGYFSKDSLTRKLIFASSGNTITNANLVDTRSFVTDGWAVGEHILIPESADNAVDLTIIAVTDRVITVSNTLTNETLPVGNIHLNSQVSVPEFFYNLIAQNEAENYLSKTDVKTPQKYYCTGFNAGDTETVIDLLIGTKSFAWVTDVITSPNISTSTIQGQGWAHSSTSDDYKQYFVLTHYFNLQSINGKELLIYLQQLTPPSIYPLTYICKMNGKYDQSNNIYHTGNSLTPYGCSVWFNENNLFTVPEYSLVSINYATTGGSALQAIDFSQDVNVTAIINSKSGLFVNKSGMTPGSQMILSHFYVPLNTSQYQGTPTTLGQNILADGCKTTIGAAEANGSGYTTPYQALKNVVITFNSANQVTVTFTISYSSQTKTLMIAQGPGNRNYCLFLTTENLEGAFGNNLPDRVAVILDVNNMVYNQNNSSLSNLVDYLHAYAFPQLGGGATNSHAGYEGDPQINEASFRVQTAPDGNGNVPVLNKVVGMVVAIKSGKDDYIVESVALDTSNVCRNAGNQNVNLSTTRNYRTYANDPWNTVSLVSDSANDQGTMKAYKFHYAFALRYDYWNPILTVNPGGTTCTNDINNDILNVNNSFSNLIQNGWTLVYRLYWEIIGYDGWITPLQAQTPIVVYPMGQLPAAGPQFAAVTTYYILQNNELVQVNGIQKGTQTKISTKYLPNGTAMPSGFDSYYGFIFADIVNAGGVENRRTASTEYPSEENSPFSAATEIDGATTFVDNGNMSMNLFSDGSIILESWFDDTIDNWTAKRLPFIVAPRLGFKCTAIENDDGTPIDNDNGQNILQD